LKKKICVIACAVLAVDLKHSASLLGLDIDYKFLEAGLHSNPKRLKENLQAAIDQISSTCLYDRIIIGYGICGRGTIGIQSRQVPLVIPKVHDCIALFLGGDQAYKNEFEKYPGTYYLSAGWCEEKTEPANQKDQWTYYGEEKLHYSELVEKHGEHAAKKTFEFLNSWQKNYQRAAYIETGAKKSSKYETVARKMAVKYNWEYHKIQGSQALIRKMITTVQSTPEILYIPPEHVTLFNAIESSLSANPLIPTYLQSNLHEKKTSTEEVIDTHATSDKSYITYGLGIDAGGTYTDTVIYDLKKNKTLCKSKSLTTKWDFSIGISRALSKLDRKILLQVELVSLSTTLATNAIVENEGQKVGMILMPPYGLGIEKDIKHHPKKIITGRLDISGKVVTAIDPDEVRKLTEHMIKHHGVTAFAVSGYAGSVNPEHEIRVKEIIQAQTGCFVSCGHELSDSLNFQTRAVTAMLNARIIPRLTSLLLDLENVLFKRDLYAPIVVVKGDGTLMSADMAKKRPVETILSGPAASVAGARHLTGEKDALVVDMGGTTTDTASLTDNHVSLNEKGSKVGGHRTHVKALDIRTTGLGGDSLIGFDKGEFVIGPKRVAPVSWMGHRYPGTKKAIHYLNLNLQNHVTSTRKMQLIALTGSVRKLELTTMENQLISILKIRPHSIDELVHKTRVLSDSSLSLSRLEENFIIQRSGLTLTDLLHINGQFNRWDSGIAEEYCRMFSFLTQLEIPELISSLLEMGVDRLALEVLKHQLSEEVDPEGIHDCPVCNLLVDHILTKNNSRYDVSINLKRPIIGIGAPILFFLKKAAEKLGADAILPNDADVANAIGAITSHVVIKKQLRITPGAKGGFRVEGIAGIHKFKDFLEADRFARDKLTHLTRKCAYEAGTSSRSVTLSVQDKIPKTVTGDPVFMGRTITASLTGRPDIVLNRHELK